MSEVRITPLGIDEVRKIASEDGSLWIVNYTDRGRQRNRGVFHMSMVDEAGATFAITVPNTWIPIDISVYGSVKQFIKSQNFLDAFRKRDIVCITAEQANKMLNTAEARNEIEKVNLKYNKTMGGGIGDQITINATSSINTNNMPSAVIEDQGDEERLTPSDEKLLELVDRFNRNSVSDAEAEARLVAIQPPPGDETFKKALMSISFTTSPFYLKLVDLMSTAGGRDGDPTFSDKVEVHSGNA